jgi:mannan endo-1,4-beta-mannosidase
MKKILLLLGIALLGFFNLKAADGFYVSGSSLKDANGNTFVIRGINNAHIWFDKAAYDALPDIAANKVNCVRIVWQTNGSASRLDQIIQKCIDLKMVPMVELHDATGKDSYTDLEKLVNYWLKSDVKAVVSKHAKYIMVNIANEYGSHNKTSWDWKEDYKKAITALRNGGINTLLVIDAPGWGQNSNGPLWYGQELINHDPKHNILLSVHMYGSWNDPQKIKDKIDEFKSKNLPLLIGEFGYNYNNGTNNLGCKVDHKVLMQKCQEKGYGYMAWSWYGNNTENKWLDMTSDWKTLNYWGKEVIDNTYGIKNTSKTASVFSSGSTGAAPIGKTIWIKANANGRYVCADNNLANTALVANRTGVGYWEKFDVIDAGSGYIALKANTNGNYVCADKNLGSNAPLVANRTKIGSWEKFQWVDAGSGFFALKAYSTGKYVCADRNLGAHAPVVADRSGIGSYEKFTYGQTTKSASYDGLMSNRSGMVVYPNPSSGRLLNLEFDLQNGHDVAVFISDQMGKIVFQSTFSGLTQGANQLQINIGRILESGIYFVGLNKEGNLYWEKLLVE